MPRGRQQKENRAFPRAFGGVQTRRFHPRGMADAPGVGEDLQPDENHDCRGGGSEKMTNKKEWVFQVQAKITSQEEISELQALREIVGMEFDYNSQRKPIKVCLRLAMPEKEKS